MDLTSLESKHDKMLVTDDFGKVAKRPDSFMDHADASQDHHE